MTHANSNYFLLDLRYLKEDLSWSGMICMRSHTTLEHGPTAGLDVDGARGDVLAVGGFHHRPHVSRAGRNP